MSTESNKISFELGIKRVKLQNFGVDESIEAPANNAANINIEQQLVFSIPDNLVTLTLFTKFSEIGTEKIFAHGVVQNSFIVKDLATMANKNNPQLLDLPDQLLVTILSISISHSRALIAASLMGTRFQDIYIPIVNPSTILHQLFVPNPKKTEAP